MKLLQIAAVVASSHYKLSIPPVVQVCKKMKDTVDDRNSILQCKLHEVIS